MSEKIGIQVEVDGGNSGKTLGDLKAQFERLNQEIEQVDVNSKEFKRLQAEIVKTGGEAKNLELSLEALDNEQVASAIGGVAGAIGDVTTSMVLLGVENENLQEMAQNIELAMGVSMGLKGAIEGTSAGMKLFNNVIKKNAVVTRLAGVATGFFGKALVATGIGAIILLLGSLIANFDKVKEFAFKVGKSIADLWAKLDSFGGVVGALLLPLKALKFAFNGVIEVLKTLGIVESDQEKAIRQSEEKIIKAYDNRIKKLEELEKASKKQYDTQLWYLERELKMAKVRGEDTTKIEQEILKAKIKATNEQLRLSSLTEAQLRQEIALKKEKSDYDKEEVKALEDKANKLTEINDKYYRDLKVAQDDLALFEIEKQKIAREKYREHLRKKLDEFKAHKEQLQADNIKLVEELEQEQLDNLKREREQKQAWQEGMKADEQMLRDAELEDELTFEQERQAQLQAMTEEGLLKRYSSLSEFYQAKQQLIEQDLQNAQASIQAVSNLNELVTEIELQRAGNNEKKKEQIRKASFERQKKLNMAMAVIDGAKAITSILAQYPKFDGGIAMALALTSSAIATATQIAKIKATKYQGGAVGGGSTNVPRLSSYAQQGGNAGNGVNINPVSNTSTVLGDTKVYVTEQDITNTQHSVQVIEANATF